jgi:hypothetical protein
MPERPPPASIEPPPMSTTSVPTKARRIATPAAAVAPPILASDILREEVAPRAPGRNRVRIWLTVFAFACLLSAAAAHLGYGPHTERVFEGCLGAALIAALGAVLPIPYALRALLAMAAGLALLVLGAVERGPLAPIGENGVLPATAALAFVCALPASLLFRGRYRAFKAARAILTVALLVSLPCLVLSAIAAFDSASPLAWRIANGLLAASILTGLFGYMGEETSAGCAQWAALAMVVFAGRVGVAALFAADDHGRVGYTVAAAGALAASTLVAYGLFQLLATLFSERARAVDVHKVAGQPSLPVIGGDRDKGRVSEAPLADD